MFMRMPLNHQMLHYYKVMKHENYLFKITLLLSVILFLVDVNKVNIFFIFTFNSIAITLGLCLMSYLLLGFFKYLCLFYKYKKSSKLNTQKDIKRRRIFINEIDSIEYRIYNSLFDIFFLEISFYTLYLLFFIG